MSIILKVLIIATDVSGALVFCDELCIGTIKRLPPKLRDRTAKALETLQEKSVTKLAYDKEQGLRLSVNDAWYPCESVPGFLLKDFIPEIITTVDLLYWYSNQVNSRKFGGQLICPDCDSEQSNGAQFGDKCQYSICPSHKKWAEVIDGYIPPDDLVKKAFMGIPRTGYANSWAQKG